MNLAQHPGVLQEFHKDPQGHTDDQDLAPADPIWDFAKYDVTQALYYIFELRKPSSHSSSQKHSLVAMLAQFSGLFFCSPPNNLFVTETHKNMVFLSAPTKLDSISQVVGLPWKKNHQFL